MSKISVVAPIALTEKFAGASDSWRHNVNSHARLRTRLLLRSFLAKFDQSAVDRIVIVCPDRDYALLQRLIDDDSPSSAITLFREAEFLGMCGIEAAAAPEGWRLQQIIKLGFARICQSSYYLTLDSDIVQFRDASLADLFPEGGKSLIGVETCADYDRLYAPEFSKCEQEAKQRYYETSQHILAYDRHVALAGRFYSETPVILNKIGVAEMLDYLAAVHGRPVADVLSEYSGWTEYSLYFQFLEMTNALEDFHVSGGCNAVLSLERSVWQPASCYRSVRFYDRPHFTAGPQEREGPFVAIQSWIVTKEWLPAKYRGLSDFYRRLEGWIFDDAEAGASSGERPGDSLADPLNQAAFLRILEQVDPSSALYQRSRKVLDESLEAGPPIPKATTPGEPKFLTIGMTTHDDYDGCYFTIQAIRLYHPEILDDIEFLVIDNNPAGPCARPLKALENFVPNYRYIPHRSRQGTAVRDLVFRHAGGEFVLCIDCHVFFPAGILARLMEYCRRNPETRDLLQGPLISDAFEPLATHFEPDWSHGMYGVWGMDERGADSDASPFEIGMQGLGVFACRRESWPGLSPRLAGFGGEEGYIHEKIRRAGGRNLCLPFLRWMHRFERPMGVPYKPDWMDRVRNYLLIYNELNLDPSPVIQHFEEFLGKEPAHRLVCAVQAELRSPFRFFDAMYCVNLDKQTGRWTEMRRRFRRLGIDRAVRRFAAAETPVNHHIGCALSHRRIIAEAKQQGLESVLVFEDDARFSPEANDLLGASLAELHGREWQLLYLGGYRAADLLEEVQGCRHLVIPGWISCTHAIAYHCSVYDAILDAVPDNAVDIALWLRTRAAIDKFYNQSLDCICYLTWPVVATQSSILSEEAQEFDN